MNLSLSSRFALLATGCFLVAGPALAHNPGEVGTATSGHLRDSNNHPVNTSNPPECVNLGYSVGPDHPKGCTVQPPPPPPPPAAAPAAPPPPPQPTIERLTVASDVLFAFDKAVIESRADGRGQRALDEVVDKIKGFTTLNEVTVTGHTDRIGSDKYNQKLSERRANAVRDYMIGKGLDGSKIKAEGKGETQPLTTCKGTKVTKALKECLQPNRRVDIEVRGEKVIVKQ